MTGRVLDRLSPFRIYGAEECGPDGYPFVWHETVKHAVREQAGYRCVRCLHPYVKGIGEWSPCDDRCRHGVEAVRFRTIDDGTWWEPLDPRLLAHAIEVEAHWRILTVHHLNDIKADLRWWNLASLCQRCHLRIQRTVVMPRVFPWEHSEWFKPYAAGWYAHAYLGEDLDREQVMERLDELLSLERLA